MGEKRNVFIAPFTAIGLMLLYIFLLLVDISPVIIALKGPLHSLQYTVVPQMLPARSPHSPVLTL
jgi:hypothetical protein